MGMNADTANNIKQGLDTLDSVFSLANTSNSTAQNNNQDIAEERAKLTEQEAMEAAANTMRSGEKEAKDIHEKQESSRSRQKAQWGQSGVALTGSRKIIQENTKLNDRQAEEDILYENERAAQATARQGHREANSYRIASGITPSTLSLGSTIYKNRR